MVVANIRNQVLIRMPGLFKSKKQSKQAKRRFEHLMVVAKENPNRVFDLTECELSAVPSSLFVQCRVFLTESLLLHTNIIKSLKGGGNMTDLSNLRVSISIIVLQVWFWICV